uniref:Uncharacterized protein AlNc14C54G4148 n=1 Tax=Albugo laibachii Nc14 TaxID=890382 RepID=F0WBV9_9STRA|nr:conserved hypothetical protein [Albugo laibachii Nc14]|eukprot:CCA18637.1 conserved hypothetical protein [Albugo laibachii Nc14]
MSPLASMGELSSRFFKRRNLSMASARAARYEGTAKDEEMDALSVKLKDNLRMNIRYMADYEVLSEAWIDMAKQVERIGEITEMERKLPKAKGVTVWECEEVALRYILEDGKLNLCLRNLIAYNNLLRAVGSRTQEMSPEMLQAMHQFEKGMGLALKNAWLHAEAVHITDLPQLVEYVHSVLRFAVQNPNILRKKEVEFCQETSVIYYLFGMTKQLESMDESRLIPLLVEKRIFQLLIKHLLLQSHLLQEDVVLAALDTLSSICGTEHFQSHPEEYLDSDDHASALWQIRDAILSKYVQDVDYRRRFRPLLDRIQLTRQ